MQTKIKHNLLLLAIAGLVIFLDQITKSLVIHYLDFGQSWMPISWLAPFMRIIHVRNTGAAFGIFQNSNLILLILSSVISIAIIWYYQGVDLHDVWFKTALGLQLGGALGNIIDRVRLGNVTDFISMGSFAVFNIADAAVTLGVVILLLHMLIQERKAIRKSKLKDIEERQLKEE